MNPAEWKDYTATYADGTTFAFSEVGLAAALRRAQAKATELRVDLVRLEGRSVMWESTRPAPR